MKMVYKTLCLKLHRIAVDEFPEGMRPSTLGKIDKLEIWRINEAYKVNVGDRSILGNASSGPVFRSVISAYAGRIMSFDGSLITLEDAFHKIKTRGTEADLKTLSNRLEAFMEQWYYDMRNTYVDPDDKKTVEPYGIILPYDRELESGMIPDERRFFEEIVSSHYDLTQFLMSLEFPFFIYKNTD